MITITYSKKAFSNLFDLFSGGNTIGYLKFSNWKSQIEANLNGKNYLFTKKGFWKQGFNVYITDSQELMAEIEFSNWKQKAEIIFNGEKFIIKNGNFWGTKWNLVDANKQIMDFQITKQFWNDEGTISYIAPESEKMNLLILIGLATINIYRRRAAAAAA